MSKKYFVVESNYIGPNDRDSFGNFRPSDRRELTIQTEPGCKNLSGEVCIEGELGTFNDWDFTAIGEYGTLEAARKYAEDAGFKVVKDDENLDEHEIETRITIEASYEQWDALDFFDGDVESGINGLCEISADTTDKRLSLFADIINTDAVGNYEIELHGTYEALERYRDELREEAEENVI